MASDLAKLYLVYYTQYSSQNNDGTHTAQGREDGSKNQPGASSTDFGFYEDGVVNKAVAAVQQLKGAVKQELQAHESNLANKEADLDSERASRRQNLTNDQQAETQLLDSSAGKSSPKYQHLEKMRTQSESSLNRILIDVDGRPLHCHFVPIYFPLLALLTLLEVPINQQAFAFLFDHQPAVAYLVALAVGLFFVFFAHMTGWMVRITGHNPGQNKPPTPYLVVAGLSVFVLVCMYFLASMRAAYLNWVTGSGSDEDVLSELGLLEVATEAVSGFTAVFSSPEALTFLLLNGAIFLVGAFLSFFRHDPHKDYENVKKEHEKAVTGTSKMLEDFNTRSIEIIEKYQGKMKTLNATLKNKEDEVKQLRDKIVSIETDFSTDVELVRGVVAQEISAYQAGNNSSRTDSDPQYFGATFAGAYIANAIKSDL